VSPWQNHLGDSRLPAAAAAAVVIVINVNLKPEQGSTLSLQEKEIYSTLVTALTDQVA
jgi:hypothetical protein